jgi:hypothetical protein
MCVVFLQTKDQGHELGKAAAGSLQQISSLGHWLQRPVIDMLHLVTMEMHTHSTSAVNVKAEQQLARYIQWQYQTAGKHPSMSHDSHVPVSAASAAGVAMTDG